MGFGIQLPLSQVPLGANPLVHKKMIALYSFDLCNFHTIFLAKGLFSNYFTIAIIFPYGLESNKQTEEK